MKKVYILLASIVAIVAAGLILAYIFKPMTMNDIYDEPNFTGTVVSVEEGSMTVAVDENQDAYKSSDLIVVSLDVKLKDSMTDFKVGEKVKVFYSGVILESYPAQVNDVYAILVESSKAD